MQISNQPSVMIINRTISSDLTMKDYALTDHQNSPLNVRCLYYTTYPRLHHAICTIVQ